MHNGFMYFVKKLYLSGFHFCIVCVYFLTTVVLSLTALTYNT
jgi:hypothetical protein